MQHYKVTINGEQVTSSKQIEVKNPATLETVGTCPDCTDEQLEAAVTAARQAFPGWAAAPDEERANALHKMADQLEAHAEELSLLITDEQGKSQKIMGSEFEVGGSAGWLRHTAGLSLPIKTLEDSDERLATLHRRPLGVVASITPWNWPLMISIWHLAPALRVGCTVVVKPASTTPLSTLRAIELFNEVLPPGVLNVVTGSVGHKLPSHPEVDKVVLTGSTPTGRKVMAGGAESLKRMTLELGGNDAGIVMDDADPAQIAEGLFWGAFINNGQTCAALKRLYVPASLYEPVCEALTGIASQMKVGNGREPDTAFGPIQNKSQFDLVAELVEDAKAHGAKILCGGEAMDKEGYFYPLTLIADATDGMRIVDEEQFGPALPIIRYDDIDDAIAKANDSEFGLGASVWGTDISKAESVAAQLEAGSVWVNSHGQVYPHIPFGGVKQSGLGVEFGMEGLEEYTSIQSRVISR